MNTVALKKKLEERKQQAIKEAKYQRSLGNNITLEMHALGMVAAFDIALGLLTEPETDEKG